MNALITTAMIFGGITGFGLYLVLRGALPAGPALGPALQRLHAAPAAAAPVSGGEVSPVGRWVAARVGTRLRAPTRELRLTGQSHERYVVEKLGFPLVGLLFPPVMTFMLAGMGIQLPFVVPLAASLVLAVVFFFLVDVSLKQKAADAREQFVRAVAVYLDLVALERSAAHGPVESLERAARVGNGWVFERIQESLDGAKFSGIPPWDGLARVALRTKEQDRANTATTLLYIPTSMTVLVLFVLAGYPFLIRLATT